MTMADPATDDGERFIGALLLDEGKLQVGQIEEIIQYQKQLGIRFGEAAAELGLLSPEDLQHALARQYGYSCLRPGQSRIPAEVVAAYRPQSVEVEALRALRSQLMLRWFGGEATRRTLAVVSAGRGDGRSYLAANLAVVFSQLGERTLLVDADMRHGRQHLLFGLDNQAGLSSVLSGRSGSVPLHRLNDLRDLSVITAGPVPPNPQELLGRDVFRSLMQKFAGLFDVIIVDTPAGSGCADAQMIAALSGGALLVARRNRSSLAEVDQFRTMLETSGTVVVGAAFNRC
jgi:receptor protein-tyrosine kinase